jgi:dihydropteroate synthase
MKRTELGTTRLGGRVFSWSERTYIMGVINTSIDSFSGDGLSDIKRIVEKAKRFEEEGADIIDVGGESTRPGTYPYCLPLEEEIRCTIPVIQKLKQEIKVPLSIDTYKEEVARRAVAMGVDMVNDIWGLRQEENIARLAARENIPLVLMANHRGRGLTGGMEEVIQDLSSSINTATRLGVQEENIIVDPGIGFGKTAQQDMLILKHLGEIKLLGRPILVGPSRKSFIASVLSLPPEERIEGTAAACAIAIANGANIIRVHDVKVMSRVARMCDAIVRA